MNRKSFKLIFIISFCLSSFLIQGQINHLKTEMNLVANNSSVRDALKMMEYQGGFHFAYNSEIANTDKLVTQTFKEESVENILGELFDHQLEYKSVGNHIIFVKSDMKKEEVKKNKKINYVISGFIVDRETGALVHSASVHDVQGAYSALTNVKGKFELELPADNPYRSISFSKKGYEDTIIIIHPKSLSEIQIQLTPIKAPVEELQPKTAVSTVTPIDQMKMVGFLVADEVIQHAKNMSNLQQYKAAQVSFLPFAGTHMGASGSYTNHLSLNILAGYSGGVNGLEIGGLANINRGGMQGVQIGGLANIVGGNIKGVQVGGLINTCKNGVKGAQVGGIFNHNTGAVHGLQMGGIFNDSRDRITGAQIAGIANYHLGSIRGMQLSGIIGYAHDSIYGAQIAGIANYADSHINGAQIAGIINTATNAIDGVQISGIGSYAGYVQGGQISGILGIINGKLEGTQISGIANFARQKVQGTQVAGISNVSLDTNAGIQIAPIINIAEIHQGLQIGLVNLSDSTSGISLGLINYSKKGYHQWEISTNEILYGNIRWKSGSNKFYNIYGLGLGKTDSIIWAPTLGFGNLTRLGKKLNLTTEISVSHINENELWSNNLNLLNRLETHLEWNFADRFKLAAGPSLNIHITNIKDHDSGDYVSNISKNPFFESNIIGGKLAIWPGFSIGLRF